jgi:hypothetical protein
LTNDVLPGPSWRNEERSRLERPDRRGLAPDPGRYPRGVFDFMLGMNRWSLCVVAYAGLMTDEYPPFRLDMDGGEPGAMSVGAAGLTRAAGRRR